MELTYLKLKNFRSYKEQDFNFHSSKNIIIGDNGLGKSNIIEAIYYLALTKSFRTSNDIYLINKDSGYSVVEGIIIDKIPNSYKIITEKHKKSVYIDNNQIRRLSDYISKINVINFSGEDLKLVKDGPSSHRQLINIEISQLNNNYLKALSIYNKLLKQRNIYLKKLSNNQTQSRDFLYILTEKLIDYGLIINNIRNQFITQINNSLNDNFFKITGKNGIKYKYISDYTNKTKAELVYKYNSIYNQELMYGQTKIGIHIDDYIFYFNDKVAKNFLSEGEQKNVVISFKLSEIDIFYIAKGSMPIIIFDDLFSELDMSKVKNVLEYLNKNMQIFITATDLSNINEKILKNSKVFKLINGKVEEKVYE